MVFLAEEKTRIAHAQVAGTDVSPFMEGHQRSLMFWGGIAQLALSPAHSCCIDLSGFCYN